MIRNSAANTQKSGDAESGHLRRSVWRPIRRLITRQRIAIGQIGALTTGVFGILDEIPDRLQSDRFGSETELLARVFPDGRFENDSVLFDRNRLELRIREPAVPVFVACGGQQTHLSGRIVFVSVWARQTFRHLAVGDGVFEGYAAAASVATP